MSSACCLRWWDPERGGAIYLVLGIACLLMVLLLVDHIRNEREEKAKKQDAVDADKE